MKISNILKLKKLNNITKKVIVAVIFFSFVSGSAVSINIKSNDIEISNFEETNVNISNGLAPRSKSVVPESTDVKSAPIAAPSPINYENMYGYNADPGPEETFYFPIDDPSEYNYLGETISGDFLAGGTYGCDGIWYACQYGDGLLYGIDPYTGDMWSIGGGGTGMNGLAYDPVNNRMYGSSDSNALYEIDPDTGEQELIGSFGNGVEYMIGMAFDNNGILYGWDLGNDALWTIDTESGEATQVGPLGIDLNYAQDGDFYRETDSLYLTAYTNTGQLYECDKYTGTCTLIGTIGSGVETTASIFTNCCGCGLDHDVELKSIDAPVSGRAEPNMPMLVTVKNTGNNTETFDAQMEIIKCESGPLIFEEYFDDCVMPDGWETDYWTVVNSSNAGGEPCEASCYKYDQYNVSQYYDNYVQTPPIDCSGYEKVNLRFRLAADFGNYAQYASLYVKVRRNSTLPWKDVTPWDNPVGENLDGELYEIGCYGFGEPSGDEFQVRWEYIGYYYYFNYLYLDDITLEGCGDCAEYGELVEDITLAPGEETQVSFPPWTPSEWQNESAENTWEEYPVHAFVIFDGDQNPRNDKKWALIDLWYPWMHDIEVMSIDSPQGYGSIPAQTFPVQATMRNVGQFAECCIPIDISIGSPYKIDTLLEESTWANPYPSVPADDWTDEHKVIAYYYGWRQSSTSYSGGSSYEAYIPYYYCRQDYYFYSYAIDTTAYQSLKLRFLTYINHYSGQGLYTLEAGYSTDGETWYAAWSETPDSTGGYEVDVPVVGGSESTYIGFWVKGNPFYFNYWYIDNVELVATGFTEEYSDFACQGPDIEPGKESIFTFEDWTPEFLVEEISGSKDYIVEASIEMEGDKNPGNDIRIEYLTLDFWHDVGIDEILSPTGGFHSKGGDGVLWDNGEPDERNALAGSMYMGYSNIIIDDVDTNDGWLVQGGLIHLIWNSGSTSNVEKIRMYFFADNGDCDPSLVEYPEEGFYVETAEFTETATGTYYFSRPEIIVDFLFGEYVILPPGKFWIGIQPDGVSEDIAYILTAVSKDCMVFADLPYWGYPRWSSSQELWGSEYDIAFEIHGSGPPCGGPPRTYIQPGIENIDILVENYGTFPKEDLTCFVEIWDHWPDPENGTLVYKEQIDDIDLTTPLGGQEELNFPDYTFEEEGRYYMYVEFPAEPDDNIWNNNEVWIIHVDDTKPISEFPPKLDPPDPTGENGWYVDDVTITLNATDPLSNGTSSGVKEIRYTINGGAEQVIDGSTDSFVLTQDGDDILVEYWAVDWVGNVETPKNSFTLDIDQTVPDVSLSYEVLGWTPLKGWEFQLTATANDAMSGMNRVEFYLNNELQHVVTGAGPEYVWTLFYIPLPGNQIFRATAFDNAGLFCSDELIEPTTSSHSTPQLHQSQEVPREQPLPR